MCIKANDFVFEIGPGKELDGFNSSKTDCCYSLTVLEKDKELIPFLKKFLNLMLKSFTEIF